MWGPVPPAMCLCWEQASPAEAVLVPSLDSPLPEQVCSLGQGLLVWLCAQERKKGRSLAEVRDFAEAVKGRICHWFTVDDLNHLKRGGRISATTALPPHNTLP